MKNKVIFIILFSYICRDLLLPYWKMEDKRLLNAENRMLIPIAIGDGHSNGKNRIYATEYEYDTVNWLDYSYKSNIQEYEKLIEFYWNGINWEETIIFDHNKKWNIDNTLMMYFMKPINTVVIGDARNDGKRRLYVSYLDIRSWLPGGPPFSRLMEYEWTGITWTYSDLSYLLESRELINQMTIGDARNDGKNRLYIGNAFSEVSEYTWTGSTWTKEVAYVQIPAPGNYKAGSTPIISLIIDNCKGDGKKRIYGLKSPCDSRAPNVQFSKSFAKEEAVYYSSATVLGNVIVELEWDVNKSTWIANEISGDVPINNFYPPYYRYFRTRIKTGDIKGIGKNNIYYIKLLIYDYISDFGSYIDEKTKSKGQMIELSWDGSKWNETVVYNAPNFAYTDGGIDDVPYIVGIVDAKNDGKKRLYIDEGQGWLDSKSSRFLEFSWDGNKWDMEIIANEYMQSIIIGQGRNDGKNRIYAAPGYELTYNPVYVEKVNVERLVPVNNYFNPMTGGKSSIVYKIKDNGKTSLKVYSLTGELMKTLFNENKNKGEYTINWDGTNDDNEKVGSGIYLIHLEGQGISETKKICVVK